MLNSLVEAAARLSEADTAQIFRPTETDGSYYTAAGYGLAPDFQERAKTRRLAPGRGTVTGRVLLERKSVQIPDVFADPEYTSGEVARLGGWRTILGVPLLREGLPIGLVVLHRATMRPCRFLLSCDARHRPHFTTMVIGHQRHPQERGVMTDIQGIWPFVIATIIVTMAAAMPVAMVYLGMFVLD